MARVIEVPNARSHQRDGRRPRAPLLLTQYVTMTSFSCMLAFSFLILFGM
jgi:hypothetical protein